MRIFYAERKYHLIVNPEWLTIAKGSYSWTYRASVSIWILEGLSTVTGIESCIDVENSYLINDCNDIVSKVVPFIGWKHMKDETKVALEKKCFFKLFNAVKFHTNYDKENYENI